MDDLAGKISEILNDPASMEKIKSLSSMLGISPEGAEAPQASPAQSRPQPQSQTSGSSLNSLLGSLGGSGGLGSLAGLGGDQAVNPEILQSVLKIAPLLSSIQQEDDNTRLLYALRPFLKPERQKKLDESANMMRMFKLIPLLKGSGIL